ncbi:MAG TPA: dimethylamine monooxygenase subunit DmmA family protein [Steroidobacteraceae bacterium]|nr:dimethylamine monooxygenase subunit DmmA family protein [Steroidobacteraceae bacterium]
MLVTGIKSKPVYAPLQADTRGRYHLMLGLGVGAAPLLRVIDEMRAAAASGLKTTRVLFVPDPGAAPPGAAPDAQAAPEVVAFKAAGIGDVQAFGGTAALLEQFRTTLAQSLMGTRLYVAGPESFIGLAMKIALEFNLNKDEIRAEECGSLARRVYCIHCRTTTEFVRTNIVRCAGCARWLLVRDHYSRRLAAYMGVMVDAEAPGELPPLKEVFL